MSCQFGRCSFRESFSSEKSYHSSDIIRKKHPIWYPMVLKLVEVLFSYETRCSVIDETLLVNAK